MEDKDAKLCLGRITAHALSCCLNVLLELLDGVLERCPGVVDLINNEDLLANQVLHLAKSAEVKPLGASNLGAGLLDLVVAERLVEGQTNGLDRDVGRAGLLQKRAQDTGGNVTTTADGDHELRLEVIEQLGS